MRCVSNKKLTFSASGEAGDRKVIVVPPECLFRGEDIDAKDTLDGAGTEIEMILVGKKLQKISPTGKPIETRELMREIRQGFEFKMDTCDRSLSIAVAVKFKSACEFRAEISGKAVR